MKEEIEKKLGQIGLAARISHPNNIESLRAFMEGAKWMMKKMMAERPSKYAVDEWLCEIIDDFTGDWPQDLDENPNFQALMSCIRFKQETEDEEKLDFSDLTDSEIKLLKDIFSREKGVLQHKLKNGHSRYQWNDASYRAPKYTLVHSLEEKKYIHDQEGYYTLDQKGKQYLLSLI